MKTSTFLASASLLLLTSACVIDGNEEINEFEILGALNVTIEQCFGCLSTSIDQRGSEVQVDSDGFRWVVSGPPNATVLIRTPDVELLRTYGSSVVDVRRLSGELIQAEAYNGSQIILDGAEVRQVDLVAQDSARIDLANAATSTVSVRANDNATMVLSGRAARVNADVRQGSRVDASSLDAREVFVDLRNSARGTFCALDLLDATTAGGASLTEFCR